MKGISHPFTPSSLTVISGHFQPGAEVQILDWLLVWNESIISPGDRLAMIGRRSPPLIYNLTNEKPVHEFHN